jgi:hypothetical protein
METIMELYWEKLCATSFGGSYNILFRNTKYNVCQETIINLDKDGKPESEEVIYYFDGEIKEFKTEEELIIEIKSRGL